MVLIHHFIARQVERQSGDKESVFRDILLRLQDGKVTESDYNFFINRSPEKVENSNQIFENATRLFVTNSQVDEYNDEQLNKLQFPLATIDAVHNDSKAKKIDPES